MNPKTVLLCILILITIVGCDTKAEDNNVNSSVETTTEYVDCEAKSIEDVDEIVIGSLVPLSKPGAVNPGMVMLHALNIALEDINSNGGVLGKPIRLLVEDTRGDAARGALVAERLITEDCVVAIVGTYHSAVGLTVKDVVHQYHIPTIFAETYADDITASLYPEVFRIAPTSTFTSQLDAQWAQATVDYNNDGELFAVILAENTGFGLAQVEVADIWFPHYGVTHEAFVFQQGITDYSDAIEFVQNLDIVPDVIITRISGDYALILQKQLTEAGLGPNENTLIITNQIALDNEFYWEAVPDGNWIIAPRIGPWFSTATPLGLEFAEKYSGTFDRWPEAYAFEAYDSLLLMADAIERAGSIDPDKIIEALEDSDIELASGHYYFPYGSDNPPAGFVPDFMWHQWPDVPLLFLQYTEVGQKLEDMDVIWPETYDTLDGPPPYIRPEPEK